MAVVAIVTIHECTKFVELAQFAGAGRGVVGRGVVGHGLVGSRSHLKAHHGESLGLEAGRSIRPGSSQSSNASSRPRPSRLGMVVGVGSGFRSGVGQD